MKLFGVIYEMSGVLNLFRDFITEFSKNCGSNLIMSRTFVDIR